VREVQNETSPPKFSPSGSGRAADAILEAAWHQLAAGRLAGWGMRLLYGVPYTDMCAFRAIRRDVLLQLGMREPTYGWNLEMQMRAARAGLRVLEIPVDYRRRRGGHSKVAGKPVRDHAGGGAHRRHLRPGRG
jgi:hypothetical protein